MDVVFNLFRGTWGDVVARDWCFSPDRMLQQLMVHPHVDRMLVVEALRSGPVQLGKRLIGRTQPEFPGNSRVTLESPLRLRRRDPRSTPAVRRHYRRHGHQLEAAARRAELRRPLLITSNPFVAAYAPLDWASRTVLYLWDDWAAHPDVEPWWPAYEKAYEVIRTRGLEVWAVSHAILNRIQPRDGVVVPNGVEPREWEVPGTPPDWFAALPRPRLLYTGALDGRLDLSALGQLADELPDASIVLVGFAPDPTRFRSLGERPNVHVAEGVPHPCIPALVAAADVCLIPHIRDRLTQAMSPLKLYEYLAGGRPVVATDLEPIRGVDGPVIRVPPRGDFVQAVRHALKRGPLSEAERRRLIDQHSWEGRFAPLLDCVLDTPPEARGKQAAVAR